VRVFAESDGAPQDAVELAVEQGAQIVSLSFGWSDENVQPVLETTLRETRAKGVIVVVASGDGARSWPGDMPEILSVGGVFADLDDGDALQVSNLASGYISDQYPGRIVPDVCGLCGQKPLGTYIPMPCPAGSDFDRRYAESDGTAPDDGWFVGSGTSAAAPQVAGVIALLLEQAAAAGVPLSPPQIVHLLQQTCRVVSRGANAMDIGASGNRPNAACGFGLVDATAAIAALRTTPMV
jgi:subtilisin family serine protease